MKHSNKKKKITKHAETKKKRIAILPIIYTIVVLLFMFAVFHAYRNAFTGGLPAGSEGYYHERMAKAINEKGILSYDSLSFSGRTYIFSAYDYLLALAGKVTGVRAASIWIPLAMAIISVFAFYGIMRKSGMKESSINIALLILAATPAFAYSALTSNPQIAAAAFLLSAFYFYMREEKAAVVLSAILFGFASLFGAAALLISLSIAGIFTIKHPERKKRFSALLGIFALMSVTYIITIAKFGLLPISFGKSLSSIVLELGALSGIGIFELILAGIGLLYAWASKDRNYLPISMTALLLLLFLFGMNVSVYLAFACAFFSSLAINFLDERKWSLNILRGASIILILCGLLFSGLTFMGRAVNMEPDSGIVDAFSWLSNNYSGGNVLSVPKNGFYTEYFGMKAFSDDNFEYAPNLEQRLNASQQIFYSRDLDKTMAELAKNNITYIVITPEMKNGLVWRKEQEGLLFLLRNNETFKNVHLESTQAGSIEIWNVVPQVQTAG
ncbi:hypothetical protein COT07_04540 [Candidatus Woesearchaeota archaeon CG07_land_8_20_14_0_80_44_23]|nr:MAG: hypothetical protein COT07_04540 [Candidatus Woesearchaeota archaeon CG07_land_8_20_14_0_80_44_23]